MQLILFLGLWALSLLGIIILLMMARAKVRAGALFVSTSEKAFKRNALVELFFDVILVLEQRFVHYGAVAYQEMKEYTFSDIKEFIAEQVPLEFIRKKLSRIFRGERYHKERGEASHFLKSVREHKEEYRKNGNGNREV
jgi:hypothetical protein